MRSIKLYICIVTKVSNKRRVIVDNEISNIRKTLVEFLRQK